MTGNDPQLYFDTDGTPRSARFGDIYYSPQDGLSESRAVFLQGCHLPDAWAGGGCFSVLELGFGTGLNIAALMQLWTDNRPAGGHLHIFSIEGFLMPENAAAAALGNWPELAKFQNALLAQWPRARTGFHYMDFPEWGVSLTVALMDVRQALSVWDGATDAVFLDGFSPALNPDMWTEEVFRLIAARCRSGARLGTFTVAGFVRRGLQAAGFTVEKRPGYGRKRERLEAIYGEPVEQRKQTRGQRTAIIGAGIAGAALAYQARHFGIGADLFDASVAGAGASGNAAALVTPRLDAGGEAVSALFADAHAYAVQLYARLCPKAIVSEGVWHAEAQPRDAGRFDRIASQAVFAPGDLIRFAPGDVADLPGSGGLTLGTSITVEPTRVLACLLGDQDVIVDSLVSYEILSDGVHLVFSSGQTPVYDAVVITCGDGVFDLPGLADMYGLQPVRGQVEFAASDQKPLKGMSWGGYIAPADGGYVFGATHDRGDRDIALRDSDRSRNLEALRARLPQWAEIAEAGPVQSRASVRVTTRDHLPAIGEIAPGVYLLTGLGGRGFCLAPLLARDIMARITGAFCLPAPAKNQLDPSRLKRRSET